MEDLTQQSSIKETGHFIRILKKIYIIVSSLGYQPIYTDISKPNKPFKQREAEDNEHNYPLF